VLLNIDRARKIMAERGLDALVASSQENVTYSTGYVSWTIDTFHDLEVYGVIPREGPVAIIIPVDAVDHLAERAVDASVVYTYGTFPTVWRRDVPLTGAEANLIAIREKARHHTSGITALAQALEDLHVGPAIGIDERGMSPAQWRALGDALAGRRISEAYEDFRQVRMVKTEDEIDRLRFVARAVEQAMLISFQRIDVGVTELELEMTFRQAVIARGILPWHFDTTGGTRGSASFPASDYRLKLGDVIRADVSGRYRGYWCDTGRTAVLGAPPEKLGRYYEALKAGIAAILGVTKAGVPASELFRAGVETVRQSGIPHYERHHVGHGIGAEFYEAPMLTAAGQSSAIHKKGSADTVLESGMVINIELPYYELGVGGLQIEDTLVIRPGGYDLLTIAGRDLYSLSPKAPDIVPVNPI
jgi:Xaa-Pro dipeptidase